MSELLPCPFCGKRPHLIEPDDGDFNWIVSCLHCVAIDMQDISKEGVIEKWNRRHYPAEVQKAMERMTPKKVIRRKTYGKKGTDEEYLLFTEYACPTCGIEIPIMDMDTKFCADGCGQALDWSNDE